MVHTTRPEPTTSATLTFHRPTRFALATTLWESAARCCSAWMLSTTATYAELSAGSDSAASRKPARRGAWPAIWPAMPPATAPKTSRRGRITGPGTSPAVAAPNVAPTPAAGGQLTHVCRRMVDPGVGFPQIGEWQRQVSCRTQVQVLLTTGPPAPDSAPRRDRASCLWEARLSPGLGRLLASAARHAARGVGGGVDRPSPTGKHAQAWEDYRHFHTPCGGLPGRRGCKKQSSTKGGRQDEH